MGIESRAQTVNCRFNSGPDCGGGYCRSRRRNRVNKSGARHSLAGLGLARPRVNTVTDFPFGSLDFGFEFVADLQLVFDEIVQPVAHGLQIRS